MDARRDSAREANDASGFERFTCHALTVVNIVLVAVLLLFGLVVRWHFRRHFADFGVELPAITHWLYILSDIGWALGSCVLLAAVIGKEFVVRPIRLRLLLNFGLLTLLMLLAAWCALAIGIPWAGLIEKLS